MVFATKVAAGKARCAEEATSLVCVMAPDLHAWHGSWVRRPTRGACMGPWRACGAVCHSPWVA